MGALDQYRNAMGAELLESGRMPVVAIIGTNDFDDLVGEVRALFGATFVQTEAPTDSFILQGIRIYRTRKNHRGFWFGVLEEK